MIFYVFIIVSVVILAHKFYGLDGLLVKWRSKRALHIHYKEPIEKYNRFYQKLPDKSKVIFEQKVNYFLLTKEFIPRNIDEVTDEMKALISATAVQLTFGLPDITLKHFDKILIYPNDYYSTINRQYHKGEVNPRYKSIVLSWQHFVEGFANPTDGMNLGLHEMAHALKLENLIQNEEYAFFDRAELEKWQALAKAEMSKIKNARLPDGQGGETIYRQYASVNEDEFFAVSIELYFEQPHKLFDYSPELYKTLSNLLRQDIKRLFDKSPSVKSSIL